MKRFIKRNFKNINKTLIFLGVLFVPFVYSFVYIFGLNNQLLNSRNINLRVVVQSDDKFACDFSKQLKTMTEPIKFANMNFNIEINNNAPTDEIYLKTNNINDFNKRAKEYAKNSYASLAISPNFTKFVGTQLYNDIENLHITNITQVFSTLINKVIDKNIFTFYLNYNASPEIATGISLATTTTPIYTRVLSGLFRTHNTSLIKVAKDWPYYDNYKKKLNNIWKMGKKITDEKIMNDGILNNLSFISVHTPLPKNTNFAWLIAPFFIIIGTWMGGISLMMLISSKSYKNKSAFKNFIINTPILISVSIIQSAILTLSMLFLGFSVFGINMLYLFLTITLLSIPLAILIQLIRYIIPNKILAILILVILLVIQMTAIGGFFGTHSTNNFFRIISYAFPISYAIKLVNISLYSFTWLSYIISFLYLSLLCLLVLVPSYMIYKRKYNQKQKKLRIQNL